MDDIEQIQSETTKNLIRANTVIEVVNKIRNIDFCQITANTDIDKKSIAEFEYHKSIIILQLLK